MGMRLIDADAFDKMLIEAQSECKKNGGNFRFGVLGNVRANLALFPTVDRPEIVRCKDCVHRTVATASKWRISNGLSQYECKLHDILYSEPDWFCADGEREVRRNDT